MKTFNSFTMIRQPLDAVWVAMRDWLPEIAASLEDLHGIETLEREASADSLRLVNRWCAKQQVPSMLREALGAESIEWIDRALWREADRVCAWTIEPSVLPGHIECGGTTRYESAMAGRGTRVTFDGHFNLTAGFSRHLAPGFEPLIARFVESIVANVIPRNLSRAVQAAGILIAADQRNSAAGRLTDDQPLRSP